MTAAVLVSYDEMAAWYRKHWLSFDPGTITEFHESQQMEVAFIKGLAHSGLSDAYIDRLLAAGLEKPYCYDPRDTFFSFADYGWKGLPPEPDPATTVCDYIEERVEMKDWDELKELQKKICNALAAADQEKVPQSPSDHSAR